MMWPHDGPSVKGRHILDGIYVANKCGAGNEIGFSRCCLQA